MSLATETGTTTQPSDPKLAFIQAYWDSLNTGDLDTFAGLVDERCVVHYPGNHFLSGDHHGRAAIVDLYTKLYRIGIEPGTFVGQVHDVLTSADHAVAMVTYRLDVGAGQSLTGEAMGVFHIEDSKMVEYWLLERDQKMINDIFAIAGRPTIEKGGAAPAMALSALTHLPAVARTLRRVARKRRGRNTKML